MVCIRRICYSTPGPLPVALILMAFLLQYPHNVNARMTVHDKHNVARYIYRRKSQCQADEDVCLNQSIQIQASGLDQENCVNKCLSRACYADIFSSNPVSFLVQSYKP